MKTYSMKPSDVSRQWYVVDAAEVPLGRLATQVASLLLGKGKPTITKRASLSLTANQQLNILQAVNIY
jgi:ribosomal protein L13